MSMKKVFNIKMTVGLMMIVVLLSAIGFAEFVAPNAPELNNISNRFGSPDRTFPLGTDHLGRCILSRLIYGGRQTLTVAFTVMAFSALTGVTLGVIAGYFGNNTDRFLTGLFDIFMSFPPFVYVMALIGVMGESKSALIVALILGTWALSTKTIRTQVQIESSKLYIQSARICGTSDFKIITRHILPNILPYTIAFFSLQIGGMILMISSFSFLGIGFGNSGPEWGNMISEAKGYMFSNMIMMIYPGLCIFITVLAFSILAEGIREKYEV